MSSDTKKGFNTTVGVVLALFALFVLLPIGTCAGCAVLGAAGSAGAKAQKTEERERLGPEIEVTDAKWKVDASNKFIHKVNYSFKVKSNRDHDQSASFDVQFLDSDDLIVKEDLVLGQDVPTGKTVTVRGQRSFQPEQTDGIVSMNVKQR